MTADQPPTQWAGLPETAGPIPSPSGRIAELEAERNRLIGALRATNAVAAAHRAERDALTDTLQRARALAEALRPRVYAQHPDDIDALLDLLLLVTRGTNDHDPGGGHPMIRGKDTARCYVCRQWVPRHRTWLARQQVPSGAVRTPDPYTYRIVRKCWPHCGANEPEAVTRAEDTP